MSDVIVSRISKDGLTKENFEFEFEYGKLSYRGHFVCNRSSKRETWADERKDKNLSFADFCDKHDLDSFDWWSQEEYDKYLEKSNPVMQKTRQGKTKYSGKYGDLNFLPPCPDDVAEEAVKKFASSIKVYYKLPGKKKD